MRRMSKGCQGLFGEGARQTTRSIQPGIPYTRSSIEEASEANKKATTAMYPAWPFASEHQGRMGYCGGGGMKKRKRFLADPRKHASTYSPPWFELNKGLMIRLFHFYRSS
ncbi:hypothetical protein V1478_012866 [Vespula squamosa]|uniref:Uncharacterized protein n=1 Tax=Vespula squamosa TaxID=30214 RepID=A0ABD2A995_VESSQ